MKLFLFAIVIELVGVNYGLIGVVTHCDYYCVVTMCAAILGLILAAVGLIRWRTGRNR